MTGERLNISTLAEMTNLSRQRAKQVLQTCGIRRDSYRLYDADKALTALRAFTDTSKASGHRLSGEGSTAAPPNDQMAALANARAAAEQARARKVELEVAQKEGRLISREAVTETAVAFASHLRNGLLGMGARVATKCVGRDADAISAIIEDAMRDALADLSDLDAYIMREVLG